MNLSFLCCFSFGHFPFLRREKLSLFVILVSRRIFWLRRVVAFFYIPRLQSAKISLSYNGVCFWLLLSSRSVLFLLASEAKWKISKKTRLERNWNRCYWVLNSRHLQWHHCDITTPSQNANSRSIFLTRSWATNSTAIHIVRAAVVKRHIYWWVKIDLWIFISV